MVANHFSFQVVTSCMLNFAAKKGMSLKQLIQVYNLSYTPASVTLINRVNFSVSSGERFVISGNNGAGKSTLLKLLAGLLDADHGQIKYPQQNGFSNLIGYIGHKPALDPVLTAIQHFTVDVSIHRQLNHDQRLHLLSQWGLDAALASRAVQYYSAGQKKRLMFALLQAKHSLIWLLDEPFINCDHAGMVCIENAIANHLKAGGFVVLTQHQASAHPGYELAA